MHKNLTLTSPPNPPPSTAAQRPWAHAYAGSLIQRVFSVNARRFVFFVLSYGITYKCTALATQASAAPIWFIWFPDAVLLGWLLVCPRDEWWFYVLAPLPIRLAIEAPFRVPLWFLLATYVNDSFKGVFSAWVLERVLRRPVRLDSLRTLKTFFLVAALLTPALSSIMGAAARSGLGYGFVRSLYEWFLSNTLTALVMTPALLYWFTDYAKWKPRLKELTLLLGSLVLVLSYTFLITPGIYGPLLLYAPFPFLIWAAVRLGPIGTSTALSLIAVASIVGAAMHKGIFALNSSPQGLLSLQLFLAVISIPLLFLAVNIAEHKRTEEALRENEERLRLAQQASRIGSFECNIRTGVNTWTPELEAMYGLPPGSFGGTQTAFVNLVHPDDRAGVINQVNEAMKTGQPTNGEWRVVWSDGSVHWIAGRWQVFVSESGEPSRMIGVNIDVTEHKMAEQALATVSRRLIQAQEQERTRIARELHDDINQRIAMLSIDLEQLQQSGPPSGSELQNRVKGLQKRLFDLGVEIQAISHRLHSSKLEYLGLAAACKSFCIEVGNHHKVTVDFKAEDIPRAVPQDVSLCLFRVLQESLNNAIKYSGVQRFEVHLHGRSGEVELTVRDRGVGFDAEAAMGNQGLGLISMRERANLVNGTILITSKPMCGTEISVRVPLAAECASPATSGAA